MKNVKQNQVTKRALNRRQFIQSSATAGIAAGTALKIAPVVFGQSTGKEDEINLGIIGVGKQGQTLLNACKKIPGIRIRAVCDIWDYNRTSEIRRLKRREEYKNQSPKGYIDYEDMLAKEKDLDAVIVATPDFWHADHTVACLKAGLHVYCEKEMSNTLAGAKRMVEAARTSGKLLQIGHQRRSNPIYRFSCDKIIKEANLLNRITHIHGQWNRSIVACKPQDSKPRIAIDANALKRYGYESMYQFLNWRSFKNLGGGPIVDLGSHQIDIYNWFLDAQPISIMATGGTDYWKEWQWYDNVYAIFEYETRWGKVRALYQTFTTTGSQGYYESFMGDEGSLVVSESSGRSAIYKESHLPKNSWNEWEDKNMIIRLTPEDERSEKEKTLESILNIAPSPPPIKFALNVKRSNLPHPMHLENFFAVIRGKEQLNCPAEVGYETAVTVLKVNDAVAAGCKLEFKPEEFKV